MIASLWPAAYRAAWLAALPPIRLLIALDRLAREAAGRPLLPPAWRAAERLASPGIPPAGGNPLWMHCASLGEAKGMWALAESLPPDFPLLLTATTPAGIAYLEDRCAGSPHGTFRRASPAPFDHPSVACAFLDRQGVRGLLLYEAELWPHWIGECLRLGLPVALAAGLLTERGLRTYRKFGEASARLLASLAWIQAQSPADARRFAAMADVPITVGFDFKAAHYLARGPARTGPQPYRARYAFVSLHLAELRILLPGLPALAARGPITVFPRHPAQIPGFLALLSPLGFALFSLEPDARLSLVDSFGHVQAILPGCHTAFVGGSLIDEGCHNLWEPLAAGVSIRFGPSYRLQEALSTALLEKGLARIVADPAVLAEEPLPGPGTPELCAAFAERLRGSLETALEECGKGIIATFQGQDPVPRETAPERASEGTAR